LRRGADLLSMQSTELLACFQPTMFLRAKIRKKDGKLHRYFSVVENRRVGTKRRTVQRTVLHLVEAHIMVAFLAYCLMVTLKNRPTAAGW